MAETERDSADETTEEVDGEEAIAELHAFLDDEERKRAALRAAIDEGDASEEIDGPEAMAQLRAALRARLRSDDRGPSSES